MTVLHGEKVILRARRPADVDILHSELYDDVATRSRADSRPWRPLGSEASPYTVGAGNEDAAVFSVVHRDNDDLVGEALLWRIDQHNRSAHVGISLRPSYRGRGLASDVLEVLAHYGFQVRGLHRLQVDTLADNTAMIASARRAGYTEEGTLRRAAWVAGDFADEVILGLLAGEWGGRRQVMPPAPPSN
jgi:RimJ/RimL family protein N-acetyltransferase